MVGRRAPDRRAHQRGVPAPCARARPSPGATSSRRRSGQLALGTDLGGPRRGRRPNSLTPGLLGLPRIEDGGAISAEVWWVDRFGNCQLNVGPEDLDGAGRRTAADRSRCTSADQARAARWVRDLRRRPGRRSSCSSSTRTACCRSPSTAGQPPRSTDLRDGLGGHARTPGRPSDRSTDSRCRVRTGRPAQNARPVVPGRRIAIAILLVLMLRRRRRPVRQLAALLAP